MIATAELLGLAVFQLFPAQLLLRLGRVCIAGRNVPGAALLKHIVNL